MQQSFSSASCAAGDSPCAVRTTLQCVVANATAGFCPVDGGPIPLNSRKLSESSAGTLSSKKKVAPKSSLENRADHSPFSSVHKERGLAVVDLNVTAEKPSLLDVLSSRETCVKINVPWLYDCRNRIIKTSNASLSWISCAQRKQQPSIRCAGSGGATRKQPMPRPATPCAVCSIS